MMNQVSSNKFRNLTGSAAIATCLLMIAACSETDAVPQPEGEAAAIASSNDGDWIRLDGVVVSATPSSRSTFVLDYGADNITVEVDDWDWAAEGIALVPGDVVSVTGRVDKGLFDTETIEAGAVYVRNLNTVFYASAADEEEFGLVAAPMRPVTNGVDYTGWVTGKSEDGFTLGAGPARITVSTENLGSDYKISGVETGDRVYVWGDFNIDSMGGSTLSAKGVLELLDASKNDGEQADSKDAEKANNSKVAPVTSSKNDQ